ncbi:hypothetical protein SLEP1_g51550 [Rubroshorea leprosula]|uniref:Uncharacterized protein n=1 Tax=Rubroshorea leprosula TaxID=152421 RepID=A0AAV5M3Q5_9ROSI|nr:hypothetical protein SLEP1_g51550 [Rubroshorea leprosula]
MPSFGGIGNSVQTSGNGINNDGANNFGTGSGSPNYVKGSGSNHVTGAEEKRSRGKRGYGLWKK